MSFKYLQTCDCDECLVKDRFLLFENGEGVWIQTHCGCIVNERFGSFDEAMLFINAFTARRKYSSEFKNEFIGE